MCSMSVLSGNTIIRQRGTKYYPSHGMAIGKDHTIFATCDGFVRFWSNVPKKRQELVGQGYARAIARRRTGHPIRESARTGDERDSIMRARRRFRQASAQSPDDGVGY